MDAVDDWLEECLDNVNTLHVIMTSPAGGQQKPACRKGQSSCVTRRQNSNKWNTGEGEHTVRELGDALGDGDTVFGWRGGVLPHDGGRGRPQGVDLFSDVYYFSIGTPLY